MANKQNTICMNIIHTMPMESYWGVIKGIAIPTGQMAVEGRLLLITSRLIEEKHVSLTHNHTHTISLNKNERDAR